MKKTRILILSVTLLLTSIASYAIPAKPGLITVRQPDGTEIQIEIHGDEFLNWKTCNGRLVERAADGYLYYAAFDSDGRIVRSDSRVSGQLFGFRAKSGSEIHIPQAARDRAREKRAGMMSGSSITRNGAPSRGISKGSNKFLTILVEFPDLKLKHTQKDFHNLLNEPGYAVNKATGSARDYYTENSNNQFDPTFEIIGPYTASKSYKYYGGNINGTDAHVTELFAEIVRQADKDVDFTQYDVDNDGVVDNLFFYYAGHNEAEGGAAETIWPHKYTLYLEEITVDGKQVLDYACTSELRGSEGDVLCGIGTFCHEFGHVLGLPDFYDTDYQENGYGKALGEFSLMSSGGYNNNGNTPPYFTSFEREMLEWSDTCAVITTSGNYTLETVEKNKAYRILTGTKGEYYQFESRGKEGWDKYIPSGMLIYHIDKSSNSIGGRTAKARWASGFGINDFAAHQCCDLVEACGHEEAKYSIDDIFPGRKNKTEISATTKPSLRSWDNKNLGFSISDITDHGSAGVTFLVTEKSIEKENVFIFEEGLNAIYVPKEPLKAGDRFNLELIMGRKLRNAQVTWFVNEVETDPLKTMTMEAGTYIITVKIKTQNKTEVLTQKLNIQ